ncbi:cytoplasmic protein [Brucella sp. IR073]|uniref:cytoplasmic protein n=1 Tax=unclassified Brucella TaxID=2632610 RepID=UPI003B98385C
MTTHNLVRQAKEFLAGKEKLRGEAMQRAALQILCGIDLDRILAASHEEKRKAIRRLERLIERERLKGTSGHWSYDLNRHIALKQARERIEGSKGVRE